MLLGGRFLRQLIARDAPLAPALAMRMGDSDSAATTQPAAFTIFSVVNEIIFGGMLFAVPKKRTTIHKRRLRQANHALTPAERFLVCKTCNRPKLPHQICDRDGLVCTMCAARRSSPPSPSGGAQPA
jgi:ribosomal protein L32